MKEAFSMIEHAGSLTGRGGCKLAYRTWIPEAPKGSVVLVHGMGEYMGRYEHVARFFVEQGFAVYGQDHRGHGHSEGVRCYVDRFDDYVEDLQELVAMASQHGRPIMIGHSMGGLIAFCYALQHPESLQALILSSPMLSMTSLQKAGNRMLASVLSVLAPTLQIPAGIPADKVCRDPEAIKQYATDKLVLKAVTPRWLWESHKTYSAVQQGQAANLELPALFLQAGADILVDAEVTRAVFNLVGHDRKAFKLYPGFHHEIFNDPGRDEVFRDIMAWLHEQKLITTR
jgi:alpha-beta hydrolase superfamily lysophospholipase